MKKEQRLIDLAQICALLSLYLHSNSRSSTIQGNTPNFVMHAMVMTFAIILSLLPLHSFVSCSIGISTHWSWQNQARVRPQMYSGAVNWLPFL